MMRLCDGLRPILNYELENNNSIARVDEPAGEKCPLAIVMSRPLNKSGIERDLELPSTVKYWKSLDPHYPLEEGYSCDKTHHAIAGPIGR